SLWCIRQVPIQKGPAKVLLDIGLPPTRLSRLLADAPYDSPVSTTHRRGTTMTSYSAPAPDASSRCCMPLDGIEDHGPIRPMQLMPGPLERQEHSSGEFRFQREPVGIGKDRVLRPVDHQCRRHDLPEAAEPPIRHVQSGVVEGREEVLRSFE